MKLNRAPGGTRPSMARDTVSAGVPGELPDGPQGELPAEKRALLTKMAEELVKQGMSPGEMRDVLSRWVLQKQWPAGAVDGVFEVVLGIEQQQWKADAEAARLANVTGLREVSLADVRPRPMRWLWPGKIPLGKVTVIYGDAGLGKTCLVLDLAARVSAGKEFFGADAEGCGEPDTAAAGQVLILNGEDSVTETICPRMQAAGAQRKNVTVLSGITQGTGEAARFVRRFDLGRDIPVLRQRLESLPDARLVVIDSLDALCGNQGLTRPQMRSMLADLEELATDRGIAIVITLAASKCDLPVKNLWRVDCDVIDAGLRCWVPVRCNWGDLPEGVGFRITHDGIEWEEGQAAPTAERSRGATAKQEQNWQLKQHAEWLTQYLCEGPQPAKQVLAAATAAGWTGGQIRKAREALQVKSLKEPVARGQWVWQLPRRPLRPASGTVHVLGRPVSVSDQQAVAWLDRACRQKVNPVERPEEVEDGEEFKGGKEFPRNGSCDVRGT